MSVHGPRSASPARALLPLVAILLTVLVVSTTEAATKYREGTIVLRSGERLEDVTFWVRDRYRVIEIGHGADVRRVSFTEVAEIRYRGDDATERLLGGRYPGDDDPARQQEAWASKASDAYVAIHLKPWTVGLRGGLIGTLPFGDYYDGIQEGIGWDAEALLAFTDQVALRARVGRPGLDFENAPRFTSVDPGVEIVSQDVSFSSWSFSASVQMTIRPDDARPSAMRYLHGGLGFTHHTARAELVVREVGTSTELFGDAEVDDANFITTVGGGIVFPVGDAVGIDVGVHVDYALFTDDEDTLALSPATLVDLRVGILWVR